MDILLFMLIVTGMIILSYMTVLFVLAVMTQNNGIADIGWGIGFILVAGLTYFLRTEPGLLQTIATLFVLLWGIRLTVYVFIRNRGKAEDFRYAAWRKQWGQSWLWKSYIQVFLLQGAAMWLITMGIVAINITAKTSLDVFGYLGIIVWVFGFVYETVGDLQLLSFTRRSENKGRIMQHGLWSTTRHPNYFGEATVWWGIWIMGLTATPYTIVVVLSPVVITFLLLKVSGVPLLEKRYAANAEYEQYKKTTSAFIPRFFKKGRLISKN